MAVVSPGFYYADYLPMTIVVSDAAKLLLASD